MATAENTVSNHHISHQATSAVGHTGFVMKLTEEGIQSLKEYSSSVDKLKEDLDMLEKNILDQNELMITSIQPFISSLSKNMEMEMIYQKEQNEHIFDELTSLKLEKEKLNKMIIGTSERTLELNHEVGFY